MAPRKPVAKVSIHVSLFAYTLLTLSYGWLMMSAFHAWSMDPIVQLMVILISALLWTIFGHIAMNGLRALAREEQASLNGEAAGSNG